MCNIYLSLDPYLYLTIHRRGFPSVAQQLVVLARYSSCLNVGTSPSLHLRASISPTPCLCYVIESVGRIFPLHCAFSDFFLFTEPGTSCFWKYLETAIQFLSWEKVWSLVSFRIFLFIFFLCVMFCPTMVLEGVLLASGRRRNLAVQSAAGSHHGGTSVASVASVLPGTCSHL